MGRPATTEGEFESTYAEGEWEEEGGEEYEDEMRAAARTGEAVYSRDMPEAVRRLMEAREGGVSV